MRCGLKIQEFNRKIRRLHKNIFILFYKNKKRGVNSLLFMFSLSAGTVIQLRLSFYCTGAVPV